MRKFSYFWRFLFLTAFMVGVLVASFAWAFLAAWATDTYGVAGLALAIAVPTFALIGIMARE